MSSKANQGSRDSVAVTCTPGLNNCSEHADSKLEIHIALEAKGFGTGSQRDKAMSKVGDGLRLQRATRAVCKDQIWFCPMKITDVLGTV